MRKIIMLVVAVFALASVAPAFAKPKAAAKDTSAQAQTTDTGAAKSNKKHAKHHKQEKKAPTNS